MVAWECALGAQHLYDPFLLHPHPLLTSLFRGTGSGCTAPHPFALEPAALLSIDCAALLDVSDVAWSARKCVVRRYHDGFKVSALGDTCVEVDIGAVVAGDVKAKVDTAVAAVAGDVKAKVDAVVGAAAALLIVGSVLIVDPSTTLHALHGHTLTLAYLALALLLADTRLTALLDADLLAALRSTRAWDHQRIPPRAPRCTLPGHQTHRCRPRLHALIIARIGAFFADAHVVAYRVACMLQSSFLYSL